MGVLQNPKLVVETAVLVHDLLIEQGRAVERCQPAVSKFLALSTCRVDRVTAEFSPVCTVLREAVKTRRATISRCNMHSCPRLVETQLSAAARCRTLVALASNRNLTRGRFYWPQAFVFAERLKMSSVVAVMISTGTGTKGMSIQKLLPLTVVPVAT